MRQRIKKSEITSYSAATYSLVPVEDKKSLDQYVQDSDGIVYKVMPNHYLKLSPWKDGEDRRVHEIEKDNYRMITYKNACMIINSQFNNTVEDWEFNGKQYIANAIGDNKNIDEYSYLLSTLPNHTITISSNDNLSELKLVRHKGKMYYILIINEFLPRVKAYDLFGNFCMWAGIDNCKPVFCKTDRRYI